MGLFSFAARLCSREKPSKPSKKTIQPKNQVEILKHQLESERKENEELRKKLKSKSKEELNKELEQCKKQLQAEYEKKEAQIEAKFREELAQSKKQLQAKFQEERAQSEKQLQAEYREELKKKEAELKKKSSEWKKQAELVEQGTKANFNKELKKKEAELKEELDRWKQHLQAEYREELKKKEAELKKGLSRANKQLQAEYQEKLKFQEELNKKDAELKKSKNEIVTLKSNLFDYVEKTNPNVKSPETKQQEDDLLAEIHRMVNSCEELSSDDLEVLHQLCHFCSSSISGKKSVDEIAADIQSLLQSPDETLVFQLAADIVEVRTRIRQPGFKYELFFPEKGDGFDETIHEMIATSDRGSRVSACIEPGIRTTKKAGSATIRKSRVQLCD